MREAIGSAYIVNFIIIFIVIFMLFFIGTLSYTKAFKVKNKILNVIENHEGNIENASGQLTQSSEYEINSHLKDIGYRVSDKTTCEVKGRFSNATPVGKTGTTTYRYCIYRFNNSKGKYYGVVAYMYFEIPLIGVKLEFPVYGETRTFMEWLKKG